MRAACYEIAAVAAGRVQILLRSAKYYSRAALICQYKAQVLSSIDYTTPAIYHAPEFFLRSIDKIQEDFLSELEMSPSEALHDFNLAPLSSRRDISMLGLLHRIILKDAPVQFPKYIYKASSARRGWAFTATRHTHQLHDILSSPSAKIVERSVFRLVHPYNVLPQFVVDSMSTSSFQSKLQRALKETALQDVPEWEHFSVVEFLS